MIPKFRFWDKGYKIWLTPDSVWLDDEGSFRGVDGVNRFEPIGQDLIVMQSTGLLDVNGKEIFEGDVVKLRYTISSDYEFFKVTRFRGGSWRIDNRRRGCELWLRNEDCEIIGNVWEGGDLIDLSNPEAD
ncbi:YopX family protein [Streptococcus suis]|uniref:YopX family protein n=1 Tax=Streptococcus suis TaxID=1307 RepID=UPI0004224767|nr:YopX family protein [Streptococcus suis]